MSETTFELMDDEPTRQPRQRNATERVMSDGPELVTEQGGGEQRDEAGEALADARRQLQERDAALATANEARTRAERETQRAHAGRAQDRGAALAASVEAATSAQAQAVARKRSARDSGDLEEEIKADQALAVATYRLEASRAAQTAQQGDPTSGAGRMEPQQQQGVSQAAANWIAQHPRFNSDTQYRDAMLAEHNRVVTQGYVADSPAYFRELDRRATELEGRGMNNDRFDGASPSRGNPSNGGSTTKQTVFGPVTIYKLAGGKTRIKVDQNRMEDFKEGAKITGMPLAEYALALTETNSTETGEGRVYR